MKRVGWRRWIAALSIGIALQLVPYGREHANPPVVREPEWDRPRTRELFFRACKDCHSHETEWPWYSFVAPFSWLVQHDVEEARTHFDVSDWGRAGNHGDEAAKLLRAGDMPLWRYRVLHHEARLSEREREELLAGLVRTFGESESGSEPAHAHEHSHGHP